MYLGIIWKYENMNYEFQMACDPHSCFTFIHMFSCSAKDDRSVLVHGCLKCENRFTWIQNHFQFYPAKHRRGKSSHQNQMAQHLFTNNIQYWRMQMEGWAHFSLLSLMHDSFWQFSWKSPPNMFCHHCWALFGWNMDHNKAHPVKMLYAHSID